MMKSIFIAQYVAPKSKFEDDARKEFILNTLLIASIGLVFLGFVIRMGAVIFRPFYPGSMEGNPFSPLVIFLLLLWLVALYVLSRRGFFRFASYSLLVMFYALATHMAVKWGVEVQVALLFYILTIVMSGILISTRFAFISTLIVCLTVVVNGLLQNVGVIVANDYWTSEKWELPDTIMVSTIFFIIATVSWLSNREIEKSLVRARRSEAELKEERDSLEIKVEERTKELKEAQLEKMGQLYRFAEFGRLSSGLFHDVMNPLSSVTMNMEKVQSQEGNVVDEAKKCLEHALVATRKIEDFVRSVRRQILQQESEAMFSLNDEIRQVIEILSYKAERSRVKISFSFSRAVGILGDAVKWNQVALNLISNAIDAHEGANTGRRNVKISLSEDDAGMVSFIVKDYGVGISKENMEKIFEPFFTTKNGSNMGIGLSIVKRIVEKDFHGTIECKSEEGEENDGATFIIKFPKMHE